MYTDEQSPSFVDVLLSVKTRVHPWLILVLIDR